MRMSRNAYRSLCLLRQPVFLAALGALVASLVVGAACVILVSSGVVGKLLYGILGPVIGLVLGCLFLYFAYPHLRKTSVRLACFAVLFCWGYWCYYYQPGLLVPDVQSDSLGAAVLSSNNVLSSFFPSRGAYTTPSGTCGWQGNLYLLFHLFAILYVSGILFSLFGRRFMDYLQWRWIFPENDLNVFWEVGPNERSRRLALDLMAGDVRRQVVIRLPHEIGDVDEVKRRLRHLTACDIMFDFSESSAFTGVGVSSGGKDIQPSEVRGLRHYFLSDDTVVNLRLATAVLEAIKELSKTEPQMMRKLYVRIDSSASEQTGGGWMEAIRKAYGMIAEIHLVDEASLVARRFVAENPMLKCPKIAIDTQHARVTGQFRVLMLGFDDVARSVLNAMICDAAVPGADFSVEVHCAHSPGLSAFRADYEELCRRYNVKFICSHREFSNQCLTMRMADFNRIVISTGEATQNVTLASMCRRALLACGLPPDEVRKRMFVREFRDLRGLLPEAPACCLFGALGDIYNVGVIIDENLDAAAKELHYAYEVDDHGETAGMTAEKCWLNTSFENKESSRASVDGERNLLFLLGLGFGRAGSGAQSVTPSEYGKMLRDPGIELALAEAEHERWNAYMLTRGVRSWDLVTPDKAAAARLNGGRVKANCRAAFNRHAAIRPFAKLPALDLEIARFNTGRTDDGLTEAMFAGEGDGMGRFANLQWNDIKFVRKLPSIAEKAGLVIVRQ